MRDHLRLRCGSTIGLISLGDIPGAMFSVDIRDQKCAHFTKSQDVFIPPSIRERYELSSELCLAVLMPRTPVTPGGVRTSLPRMF